MDSQGSYVSKNLYVKMKESEPLGGGGACPAHDPPMCYVQLCKILLALGFFLMLDHISRYTLILRNQKKKRKKKKIKCQENLA